MKIGTIIVFTCVLFAILVTISTITTMVLGSGHPINYSPWSYIINILVSSCVFAYMSSVNLEKSYLAAFLVGISVMLLSAVATSIILGELSWDWNQAARGIFALFAAMLLGVGIGSRVMRKQS